MTIKYTEEEIKSIILDFDNGKGMSYKDLGEKYKRSPQGIRSKLQSMNITMNKRHNYTKDDIEFLKENYPYGNWDAICERFPNINKSAIQAQMSLLGIKQIDESSWTEEELSILRDNYVFGNVHNLCQLLPNRTYKAITTKAKRMGLHTRELWTDDEKKLLLDVYSDIPLDEVVKLFPNKNRNSIIHQAIRLKITSYDKNIWTPEEDVYIIDNWESQPDLIIAQNLNRTQKAIQARRLFLGIYRRDMDCPTYESLSKYIRGNIYKWKIDSMKSCNYRCIFTGKKDFEIHHLYNVCSILNDIIVENNFTVYDNFSDYPDEDLKCILNAFIKKQTEYPLGVCISKNIHILFHSLYGQYNNTPKQWYQFENDFRNGVYDEILKTA